MEPPTSTWLVDFEFCQPAGELPRPVCMVARELNSGETLRTWLWDNPPAECPIPLDSSALYVAYLASAETSCHLALGWELPACVLDLYAEFRLYTSGRPTPAGRGLLGALAYFGLGGMAAAEKTEMRELAMRGGPYTESEKEELMDYCETDVVALAHLFPKLWKHLDVCQALLRGRYVVAVSRVEHYGIPIDQDLLVQLRRHWLDLQDELIAEVDRDYGIYDGRTFKADRWLAWCRRQEIPWPMHESGRLKLDRQTFRDAAMRHPEIHPIRELRSALSELRLNKLSVGRDGRNRYLSGVFGSKTGRNQPSNAKAVFGTSSWIRGLIKPAEGMAVAYIDWDQQELGIAAKLSGDRAMMDSYRSGDPYLTFARMAGAVPADATKQSHPKERETYKVAALAVLMGMEARSLGFRTGTGDAGGARLLRQHKEVFPEYWRWSDAGVDHAEMGGTLRTTYGWQVAPFDPSSRPTTYRNFRLQANGAEMLRLATIAITERGIRLCAMVHDAVLVEAPVDEIDETVAVAQECMAAASRAVLRGFELGTEADVVRYPDRYADKRGEKMWKVAMRVLEKVGAPDSQGGRSCPIGVQQVPTRIF